jgi:hypothetical protein
MYMFTQLAAPVVKYKFDGIPAWPNNLPLLIHVDRLYLLSQHYKLKVTPPKRLITTSKSAKQLIYRASARRSLSLSTIWVDLDLTGGTTLFSTSH